MTDSPTKTVEANGYFGSKRQKTHSNRLEPKESLAGSGNLGVDLSHASWVHRTPRRQLLSQLGVPVPASFSGGLWNGRAAPGSSRLPSSPV